MPTIGFPTNWSVLKQDGQIQPYYYAMAYTDDHLGYQFFMTDFSSVWTQSAYIDDIISIAKQRDIYLTEELHVREVVGVLNGCLFQQFYDKEVYQKEYQSEFFLHKTNPHLQVSEHLYLTISAHNGFKWDFNLNIIPPLGAAKVLKLLKFNLFNMVFRMDMQSRSLVDVIKEKDKAIQFLLEVVDQLHGNGQVMKFKGNNENSRNSQLLRKFDYNSWVRNWKISKIQNELDASFNNIWNVMDTVSRNPDLWEFSTNYYDSHDRPKPLNVSPIAKSPQHSSPTDDGLKPSTLFADNSPETHQESGPFDRSNQTIPLSPNKKRRISNDDDFGPKSPRKKVYNDKPTTEETVHVLDHLSQSFSEQVDIKEGERNLKMPLSPIAKSGNSSRNKNSLDANSIPHLYKKPTPEVDKESFTDLDESDSELDKMAVKQDVPKSGFQKDDLKSTSITDTTKPTFNDTSKTVELFNKNSLPVAKSKRRILGGTCRKRKAHSSTGHIKASRID